MWRDNWHPSGPLVQQFGETVIYDAGSSSCARVSTFIRDNNWAMPHPVSRNLITICRYICQPIGLIR